MSSSSGEELDELLRRQVMRQRRNFEERRLFDIKNQIQGNFERSFVSLWTPSFTFWN